MKRPEELDGDLTAKDLETVDALEQTIEASFTSRPNRTSMNFAKWDDKRLTRSIWDEFLRRAYAAGWEVEDQGANVLIKRPMPTNSPRAVRFSRGRPASNASLLVAVIGRSTVTGVYDPYLDDRALQVVLTMRNLGVTFAPDVRLLGRNAARLTRAYADSVFLELPASRGEVRVKGGDGHENRLMLLADGEVVSLGCSLNNLNVNERPHRDADRGALAEFDTDWAIARPLVLAGGSGR